jgi:hypothetical protein
LRRVHIGVGVDPQHAHGLIGGDFRDRSESERMVATREQGQAAAPSGLASRFVDAPAGLDGSLEKRQSSFGRQDSRSRISRLPKRSST